MKITKNMLPEHPLKEFMYRLRDPEVFLDVAERVATGAWHLVSPQDFSVLFRKVRKNTMCSNARLRSLYRGVVHVVENGIEGDFVECGCAGGGSAALIALTAKSIGAQQPAIWLFDTFEGLPAPTLQDPDYDVAQLYTGTCFGSIDEVKRLFARLGVGSQAKYVKGLFQDTLPSCGVSKIALCHIDADWYESVKACLDHLYDKVSPGGIIQFDDYGYWAGARKATDEFLHARGISAPLVRIDYSGRYMVKPLSD